MPKPHALNTRHLLSFVGSDCDLRGAILVGAAVYPAWSMRSTDEPSVTLGESRSPHVGFDQKEPQLGRLPRSFPLWDPI